MNDSELLKMAAKAAGIKYILWHHKYPGGWLDGYGAPSSWWNPLADDGDALRLAAGLKIDIDQGEIGETNGTPAAIAHYRLTLKSGQVVWNSRSEEYGNDVYAATRRAIVRAAAEIGKSME